MNIVKNLVDAMDKNEPTWRYLLQKLILLSVAKIKGLCYETSDCRVHQKPKLLEYFFAEKGKDPIN